MYGDDVPRGVPGQCDGSWVLPRLLVRGDDGSAEHTYDLVAFGLDTRRVRRLVSSPAPGNYVVLPDRDILASHDSSFCTYLARYRTGSRVPVGIALRDDGCPLDAQAPAGERECRSYGLVALPTVGARGDLAFVASTAAKGRTGEDRVRAPHSVYLVEGGTARPIAEAPGFPRALTRSPDGARLFLSVEGDRDQRGGVYSITQDGAAESVAATVAHGLVAVGSDLMMIEDTEAGP